MNVDKFVQNFIGKDEVASPLLLTIDRVTSKEMDDGKEKLVLYWTDDEIAPYVANKTALINLRDWFGRDTDSWLGQTIVLYVDPSVKFQGRTVGGLAVRLPKDGHKGKPRNATPPKATGSEPKSEDDISF